MKKAERITLEVRALEALDLHGLRGEWRTRYGAVSYTHLTLPTKRIV